MNGVKFAMQVSQANLLRLQGDKVCYKIWGKTRYKDKSNYKCDLQ
jgi:hypothetical protein